MTTVGIAIGTPAYMAPEQAAADPDIDHRADIYAVGVMAYELLTGSLPFEGTGQTVLAAHIAEKPRRLRLRKPTIPFALEDVVLKCLAKRRSDRWQSAEELRQQLEAFETPSGGIVISREVARAVAEKMRRPIIGLPVAAILVSLVIGANAFRKHRAAVNLATSEWLPRIEMFADSGDWEAATALARQAQRVIPDSPELADLWQRFSFLISLSSEPPGARVFRRGYTAPDSAWEELGITPIDSVRYPYGLSVVRVELAGHVPIERAMGWTVESNQPLRKLNPFKLDTEESIPAGMVRVPNRWPEFDDPTVNTGVDDFFIGKYEVTNREFEEFVAAGGYEKQEYWEHPIVQSGVEIPWARAMTLFVDRTGRTGPGTWEAGDYPDGQAEYPVGGVSWYEAAAYARFAGKELPTAAHWRATAPAAGVARWLWPASNLDGTGPAPVGKFRGVTWAGAYDMIGNVREWYYNASGDERTIRGGAWNDESAYYNPNNIRTALPPLDRSPTNGFRLIKGNDTPAVRDSLRRPINLAPPRDVSSEEPVSDAEFEIMRRMYAYVASPLNATIESVDSTQSHLWIRERISFDAAYGGERVVMYLYRPHSANGPMQTLIYYPGAPAFFSSSIDEYRETHLDFVIKSGRALAFPVYQNSFERRGKRGLGPQLWIQHVNDLRRTIDYLSTRADVDTARFGYYGYSAGGPVAPLFLVLEPRLRVAVLYMSGLRAQRERFPEVEPVVFLPRVRTPVIMFSGEQDDQFPLETSAKPFFRLLGTPDSTRKHVIARGSHFVEPRSILIRESLDWLDKYLGPVEPIGRTRQGS